MGRGGGVIAPRRRQPGPGMVRASLPALLGPNAVRQPLDSSVGDPMHCFRETDRAPPLAVNENVPRARRRLRVLVCLAAAVLIAAIVAMVRLVF
jgi:hypothetical protein